MLRTRQYTRSLGLASLLYVLSYPTAPSSESYGYTHDIQQ